MNIFSFNDSKEVINFASDWCEKQIKNYQAKSILIPSGNTVIPLFELWEKTKPDFLYSIKLIQIDDVITGKKKGIFKTFLKEHLPSFAHNIEWIGNNFIQADLSLVGLGLNGHVGFHEPGLNSDFIFGCVKLSNITCDNLKLENNTWGQTYGLGALKNCKRILMIAYGDSKKEVINQLIDKEPKLPATVLTNYNHFDLVITKINN